MMKRRGTEQRISLEESSTDSFLLEDEGEEEEVAIKNLTSEHSPVLNYQWKKIVLILIVVLCALTISGVYLYIRSSEHQDYMETYEAFAQIIADAASAEMKTLRDTLRGAADSFTTASQLENSNNSFPFVTVPMFEVMAGHVRRQSGVELLSYAPLVSEDERIEWGEYSVQTQQWMIESQTVFQAQEDPEKNREYNNQNISSFIYEIGPDGGERMAGFGQGYYAPAWQTSPPPLDSNYINYNLLAEDFLDRMLHSIASAKDGLLSETLRLEQLSRTAVSPEEHAETHGAYVDNRFGESFYDHPHSIYVQPVYGRLGNSGSGLVGFVLAVVAWDRFFAALLPHGVNGIHVILSNTCKQDHTYVIHGQRASYLGPGDQHENGYGNTKEVFQLSQFDDDTNANEIAGHCVYSLRIYSSSRFEEDSRSRLSFTFGVTFAVIFGILTVSFLSYNYFVLRRGNGQVEKVVSPSQKHLISDMLPKEEIEQTVQRHDRDRVDDSDWLKVDDPRIDAYVSPKDDLPVTEEAEEEVSFNAGRFDENTMRLIDWNTDVLTRLLKQIVAHRISYPPRPDAKPPNEQNILVEGGQLLMEIKSPIQFPSDEESEAVLPAIDDDDIEIEEVVAQQLHDFVCNVKGMYQQNAFHSFEHACHVTMSVAKMLSQMAHDSAFLKDPLTQFACVFAALIHDCDHTGVPNGILARENPQLAHFYHGVSLAEQNSIELAWHLLMDEAYGDLRATLYTTDTELRYFRAVVVHATLATDLFARTTGWDKDTASEDSIRKTLTLQQLLRAGDIAHTMQHWSLFREWNERLFIECNTAYQNRRTSEDPAVYWYERELEFFDKYVLPNARNLRELGCGEEYIRSALNNRNRFEECGPRIVDEMADAASQRALRVPGIEQTEAL